jgi:RND family efflux transporter MFP subunit
MTAHRLSSVIHDLRSATLQDARSLSDGQLLDHFIEHKDEGAFAALVQRHSAMVWGVCRRMLPHHHDAEDAFQATFIVLARNAASVRRRERVASWLHGVAQRTALKARGLAGKRGAREKQVTTMPEPEAAQQDSGDRLDGLIDQELADLPEKYRIAIILCDLEGKTGKVAAGQLKVPEGTLASRLRTGRRLLARRLARQGLAPSAGALAAVLAPAATASMPAALVGKTVKAALLVAKGAVPAAVGMSAKVIALVEGAQKTMLLTKLNVGVVSGLLAVTVAVAGLLVAGAGSSVEAGDPQKDLDYLIKLAPAERMRVLAKVVNKDKDFVSARGAAKELVERGSLEAAESTAIVCNLPKLPNGEPSASIIKWVIDEGSQVKKGDKLIELDPAELVAQHGKQKEAVLKAQAEHKRAAAALGRVREETRIDVDLARLDLRVAELNLRHYKFDDALKKETLALQVDRATLLLERIKLQCQAKLDKETEFVEAKKSAADAELDRLRELEKQATAYTITAPRDGMVVYHVAPANPGEQTRLVAQGEPVRQGQKLLWISDLKRMAVSTRVDESIVHRIRAGQVAKIRVDAFPGKTLIGKVSEVAKVPDEAHFTRTRAKVYNVQIAIDGENKDLKPGMTAEITIVPGDEVNTLRVPSTAVLGKGKERFCYVLAGNELQVRQVTTGPQSSTLTEIKSGLREEDMVLRDPSAAIRRLNESLQPGKD